MRPFAIIFALVPVVFGLVMFVHFGNNERQLAAKAQSVQAGQVPPETLTVIEKYLTPSKHGGGWPHVVFRSNRLARANCHTTQAYYDSVSLSNTVTGYYFPDGYYIPGSIGQDAGLAKWVFLGFGLTTGIGFLAVILTTMKRSPATGVDLQALLTAIRNRGKSD